MTLTTERLKWLHDAATELSATKLKMTMRPDELLVLTSELLANREAQPVALDVIARFKEWNTGFPIEKFKADYVIGWVLANYYAPPAPAVPPISASDFVNGYCERTGITIDEFYESQIPMPDSTSPRGWAAVSNKPMTIKAHVELYATPQPIAPEGGNDHDTRR